MKIMVPHREYELIFIRVCHIVLFDFKIANVPAYLVNLHALICFAPQPASLENLEKAFEQ